MNPLERFMHAYLHCTVTQRLFEDTCRQLRDCEGTAERRALVDETLRLAMAVSELTEDVEALLPGARFYAARHGDGDDDLVDAFELIANSIEEDRARATSFAMFLTARRMGDSRRPRPPQVANPMRFARAEDVREDEEATEEEDVSEEETDDAPEEDSDGENDAESDDDEDDSGCRENEGPDDEGSSDSECLEEDEEEDDSDDEEPHQSAYRRRLMIEEENSRADDPFIFYEKEPKGNPLVEESNRIAVGQRRGSVSPEEMDEMRRRMEESRWTSRPSSPSCWRSHPWPHSRSGSACAPTSTWCSPTATPSL